MNQNEALSQMMNKVERFADQLASWDKRIIEIVAVGSLANGELLPDEVIQLVCTFHPEPTDDSQGFFAVVNLLARDENERASEKLGITNGVDLGFKVGSKTYLPNGVILDSPANPITLWEANDESRPSK